MGTVDVDGVSTRYEVAGEGRPVVLLHGFPDSGRLWRHQVPALAGPGSRSSSPTCAATRSPPNPAPPRPTRCRC
jgi:pimeloyl-ACP methyl ester carboxylesterase